MLTETRKQEFDRTFTNLDYVTKDNTINSIIHSERSRRVADSAERNGVNSLNDSDRDYLYYISDLMEYQERGVFPSNYPANGGFNDLDDSLPINKNSKPYGIVGPCKAGDLFPDMKRNDRGGFRNFADFWRAAGRGNDNRLKYVESGYFKEDRASGATGDIPSSGGFLIPEQFASDLIQIVLDDSIMMRLCRKIPMQYGNIKIPGFAIGDHSSNYHGIQCYWTGEGVTNTSSTPKTRQIQLIAKKLSCLSYATVELGEDSPNYGDQVMQLLANVSAQYLNSALITGDGAGKPLGLLNCPCKITVDKETSQTATTIVLNNLLKMMKRIYPAYWNESVWLANIDTYEELNTLSLAVGTGGSAYPVFSNFDVTTKPTLLGRPIYFTEHCETLGQEGDIILFAPSQYLIGVRKEFTIATSQHVKFTTGETAYLGVIRVDGQASWDEALTPENSSSTLSTIVTLAVRE